MIAFIREIFLNQIVEQKKPVDSAIQAIQENKKFFQKNDQMTAGRLFTLSL